MNYITYIISYDITINDDDAPFATLLIGVMQLDGILASEGSPLYNLHNSCEGIKFSGTFFK